MHRVLLLFFLLVGCVWLGGCVSQRAVQLSGAPDTALQARLRAVERWQLDGKLAVRAPGQAESARIQWRQDGEAFDIRLSGPAGLKAAHLYGMPGGVVFEQGERREQAGSAEVLSERLIGWPLPAADLMAWLRGLPSPGLPLQAAAYTPEGWLARVQQDDWQITFSEHKPVGALVLPGRIIAVRGELQITLVIKQWTTP